VTAYATRRDVYRYGLPRGTLGSPARLVAASRASTDVLELDGHGFEDDDELLLRATDGGTLSAPLVAGTTYDAIRLTDSTFKLSATAGGAAINLTSDGVSMLVAIALPFDEVLEFYSRWVDDLLPAHLVPLSAPVPVTVVATVAELAAKKLLQLAGHASVTVNEAELAAKARLERWAKGLPLRDTTATASANLAVSEAAGASDPRGWGSGSLP
jgi:hypothetical protein